MTTLSAEAVRIIVERAAGWRCVCGDYVLALSAQRDVREGRRRHWCGSALAMLPQFEHSVVVDDDLFADDSATTLVLRVDYTLNGSSWHAREVLRVPKEVGRGMSVIPLAAPAWAGLYHGMVTALISGQNTLSQEGDSK